MQIHHLGAENSILHQFVSELRNVQVQQDRMRFRKNLERIGEISAYELSKQLSYKTVDIETPLALKPSPVIAEEIVLCSILRAGLPLQQGLLNYFDHADVSFISAYRKHSSEDEFSIAVEYLASQDLSNKTLILADPMLATGQSLVACYKSLLQLGTPKNIHLVCTIGAPEGIDFISREFPEQTQLWIAAIDDHLNQQDYIIPGLGDAGDLAYGRKIQQ